MKMSKYGKIGTIIQHEYTSRVKSKSFLLGTILAPLGIALIMGIAIAVAVMSRGDTEKKLAVLDKTELLGEKIVQRDTSKYYLTNLTEAELSKQVLAGEIDGYLVIPGDFLENGNAVVYTPGGGGLGFVESLESNTEHVVLRERLTQIGADESVIRLVETGVSISTKKVTEEGAKEDFSQAFAVVGYILGFVIYGLMFTYGSIVMRGVIEEKANRIVEVIASSAKPFEIMFGKVVGIGLMGLTQVMFWIILISIFYFAGIAIASSIIEPETIQAAAANAQAMDMQQSGQAEMLETIKDISISPWIIIGFIFYFLAGYFIYSTLFAAVGSAVDQEQDAGQLTMPVTIPIIIPILFVQSIMSNPDGTLAIVLSLIPFFSPILMIVRIAATDVPFWQIASSIILLIGTFFGALWIASRIYRTGILMYGKKPSFKDIFKWIRLSN
jgi:ABC-2 type transport system permease protein